MSCCKGTGCPSERHPKRHSSPARRILVTWTPEGLGLFPMARPDGVIVLRTAVAGDLERLLEDGADPETQRWINIPVPYTRTDAEEELERLTGCWDDADAPVAFVVADATSCDYAGA